ncbi:unnamed protein product [Malassezia sympodialis ATCC 42132]|uniref:uncharacterized protein n=1 Tax=Malassezia sympodialis (strain ATCC 42132) TaxID=1230383 RepID=UPI0002C24DEE|nr:uncharacterized protein MSY001_0998 [Malassezia sympodialis ATCC 42132]CCU98292.1 unnamed protein product [Malassezia sympodialis ATCC 42132]|eukprot:XP_018739607.1 uncharacterized protein MSY001_0998 [Malassezia sympodialis ATCC 42132]
MSGWGSWLYVRPCANHRTGSSQPADAQGAPSSEGKKSNFFPVTDAFDNEHKYGELAPSDLNWTCPSGLSTETSVWYAMLDDGSFFLNQIIYSPVGCVPCATDFSLFQPQVQMTFRYFHPKTGENVWKSKNVDQFQVLPNDKRSCKSSAFTVTCKDLEDGSQQYDISGMLDTDLQLMYTLTRKPEAKGWKLGQGDKGGFSYFGENPASPVGHVVHRFWPMAEVSGMIVLNGRAIEAKGLGMFVQAIQGMRPNLVASKWNFANFQSREQGGSSAVLMEFTTIPDYGKASEDGTQRVPQTVTIGSIVCQGQLVAVVGATRAAGAELPSTHAEHQTLTLDPDTGYHVPQSIQYTLQGPALVGDGAPGQDVTAELRVELGAPGQTQGLIEKVDVLAEIPYMVKKLVNYVAGTKPYIYQTLNSVGMKLTCPESVAKALGLPETSVTLQGTLFEEHTFISA